MRVPVLFLRWRQACQPARHTLGPTRGTKTRTVHHTLRALQRGKVMHWRAHYQCRLGRLEHGHIILAVTHREVVDNAFRVGPLEKLTQPDQGPALVATARHAQESPALENLCPTLKQALNKRLLSPG